jgi:hypothetical protein
MEPTIDTLDGITQYPHKLMKIGPDLAQKLLDNRAINRNISKETVTIYAGDMNADHWKFNPQSIMILDDSPESSPIPGVTGRLLDAQHRLMAIVVTGKEQVFSVYWGVPHSCIIDGGRARTAWEQVIIDTETVDPTIKKKVATAGLICSLEWKSCPKFSKALFYDCSPAIGIDHLNVICATGNKIPLQLKAILVLARPVNPEQIDRLVLAIENRDLKPGTENAISNLITRVKDENKFKVARAFARGIVAYLTEKKIEKIRIDADGWDDLMCMRKELGLPTTFLPAEYQTRHRSSVRGALPKIAKKIGRCAICHNQYDIGARIITINKETMHLFCLQGL